MYYQYWLRHKGNFIALSITIVIWTGVTVFAYLMQSAVEFIIASIFVGFVMEGYNHCQDQPILNGLIN